MEGDVAVTAVTRVDVRRLIGFPMIASVCGFDAATGRFGIAA